MRIQIGEKPTSRKGKVAFADPETTIELWVSGCATESQLEAAVLAYLTPEYTVNGVTRFFQSMEYAPFKADVTGGCWNVTLHYRKNPNSTELTAHAGGGTRKLHQSLATVHWYDCSDQDLGVDSLGTPDFKRAIGVSDQKVEGVDIPDAKFEFTITKRMYMTVLPGNYLQQLYEMLCTVNNAQYTIIYNGQTFSFEKGSLLFLEFPFKMTSDYCVDISFKFVAKRGDTVADNIRIGTAGPITKEGWHYLWVYHTETHDTTTHRIVRRPVAAYQEQVFEYTDFSLLNL